jgi:hypothetical protein
VNSLYEGTQPQNAEFWKCQVLRESHVGCNKGCFVLSPIERLEEESITRLLPGLYTEFKASGVMVATPKRAGYNWILPLVHRLSIRDVYAILVDIRANTPQS